MTDNCDIVDEVPEVLQSGGAVPTGVMLVGIGAPAANVWTPAGVLPSGDAVSSRSTRRSASYTLPYGVRVSGTFASLPGPASPPTNLHGSPPSLGRPFLLARHQVNLVEPGTSYGDRLNQVDCASRNWSTWGAGGST